MPFRAVTRPDEGTAIMQPLSAPQEIASAAAGRRPSALAVAFGFVAAATVVGAVTLWVQYGTAVFFETIAAGLRACF